MCWIKNDVKLLKEGLIKVAQEDIECFKVVATRKRKYFNLFYLGKKEIFSYFMNFKYELNKLYELNKPINIYYIAYTFRVDEGFHSYSLSKCVVKQHEANFWHHNGYMNIVSYDGPFKYVSNYLNITHDNHNRKRQTEIVKCVIPKGSQYAINELGEIVSDKIILKELINSKLH